MITTISEQREELREHKEQLKNTRSELDDLRAQLEKEKRARVRSHNVCVCVLCGVCVVCLHA